MSYARGCADELRQACHDISQPIAGVLALAGRALSEADLPENARDYLNKIVGLAEWQSDVIQHWLRARDAWPPEAQGTDVLGLGLSAVAREAVTYRERVGCGRGSLGGALVSLWLPTVASRMGRRITDAARAV